MLDIPKTAGRLKQLALSPKTDLVPAEPKKVGPVRARARRKKKKQAKRSGLWSLAIAVGIPILLSAIYFYLIAADQYAAHAKFSVRSPDVGSVDLLGSLTGMSSAGSSTSDAHVVSDYINSRELVEVLDEKIDLRAIFSRPEADFLARFDPEESVEELVDYFASMVTVFFDPFTGITSLQVKSFRAEDSKLVAEHVIGMSESLVNEISRKAREDAVAGARLEVSRQETRLRLARASIVKFRNEHETVDPTTVAAGQQTIIGTLETKRSEYQTELNSLLGTMSENAPRVLDVKRMIRAVEKQIKDEQTRLALKKNEGGEVLADVLAAYEELLVEREFAQQAYLQAQTALEAARVQASKQQRYLATFVYPRLPEEAEYPDRIRWMLIIAVGSFILWAIYALGMATIKDRMA